MDDNKPSSEAIPEQDEPQLAKLVRSTEVDNSIKEWKLSSFEDDNQPRTLETVSTEVLNKMQEALRPTLNHQTEILKKEAYEKSFKEGYDEGLEKGLEEGRVQGEADAKSEVMKKMEPKLAQFENVLGALQTPYDLIEDKLYAELVELALHISETVISKSVSEHREWIFEAIQQSVAQLPESKSAINVYLHPEDLAFIQLSKASITEKWQLHENPNLDIGSCIVKQDYSSVINDWKSRFSDLSQQLLEVSTTTSSAENQLDTPNGDKPLQEAETVESDSTESPVTSKSPDV